MFFKKTLLHGKSVDRGLARQKKKKEKINVKEWFMRQWVCFDLSVFRMFIARFYFFYLELEGYGNDPW